MDPTGFILATRVAHQDTHSARPGAPVIAGKPRRAGRPPRINAVRRAAAGSLRSLAARIEPRRGSEPCRPATP